MKNTHLYPILSVFTFVGIMTLFLNTNIILSPMMIATIVIAAFLAGTFYHYEKDSLSTPRVVELALLAFIVQFTAISFL